MQDLTIVPRTSPAVAFGYAAGGALAVFGLLGFATTGLSGLTEVTETRHLAGFAVSPFSNLVHTTAGVILVVSAVRGREAAWITTMLAAAAFGVMGLVGIVVTGAAAEVLGAGPATSGLHVILTLVASATAYRHGRHTGR